MIDKQNISRDEIAEAMKNEFGFNRKLSLDLISDIIDIIIDGLKFDKIVKIHNFGTFKLNRKNSRIGRNPKTKEEYNIPSRNVVTFRASKILLQHINSTDNDN
mgnify:CR=1 FL=1|tara:strand:- start:13 stop:321 length:309 start_codon:yes stop_codon:yes gene_type:complete